MLEHGGRLVEAAQFYGIPMAQWLDLSTGINPHAYPVAPVDAKVWRRLPEDDGALELIAASYYGVPDDLSILPIAGTQAAIQALPRVLMQQRGDGASMQAAVAALTYNEYAHAWQRAGHGVTSYAHAQLADAASAADVVLLCQPNNPTGERFDTGQIRAMIAALQPQQGWLVIDEAYQDCTPGASLIRALGNRDLQRDWARTIVLRSLGKFFGLAGARAGFAIGAPAVINALREELGPWALSGPARAAAAQALADSAWQEQARRFMTGMLAKLSRVLMARLRVDGGGDTLFCWFEHPRARALYEHLAGAAILVRKFAVPVTGGLPSLRIGLPADDSELGRLDAALESFK